MPLLLHLPYFSLLLSSLLFLFITLKQWMQFNAHPSTTKLPPGPRKLPLIGNLQLLIGGLPNIILRDLAKKHGPIMHLQLGEVSANIVISSPEVAEEVLKTHEIIVAQRPQTLALNIMSYESSMVFSPYNDCWKKLRKICTNELLSTKRVQTFKSLRERETWNLMESISSSQGHPFNLSKKISSMTNSIIFKAASGSNCGEQGEFVSVMSEGIILAGGFGLHDIFPSIKTLHRVTRIIPTLERLHRRMDKVLNSIVDNHMIERKAASLGNGTGSVQEDFLDVPLVQDLQSYVHLARYLE